MCWDASEIGDGDTDTGYTRLDERVDSRLDELGGLSRNLRIDRSGDYRPGYFLIAVVDDTHADEHTLRMATALELIHQYTTVRHRLFADALSNATTTDLLLAGDALLAKVFETVEERSVGADDDRRYQQLVDTILGVTTAYASPEKNPVICLYVAAAQIGGSVAGYDEETSNTLQNIGHEIGRSVIGQSPRRSVSDRIDSLHDPLRNRLDEFVATFVDGLGKNQ